MTTVKVNFVNQNDTLTNEQEIDSEKEIQRIIENEFYHLQNDELNELGGNNNEHEEDINEVEAKFLQSENKNNEEHTQNKKNSTVDNNKLISLISLGYNIELAKDILINNNNDIDKALDVLSK